ncbi:MAG: glutamyl-tRNA reductase [Bacteroidetes bacterium]|nr:MAG: glutamyl-tRNA reductase [Bacteroidota bacterium]
MQIPFVHTSDYILNRFFVVGVHHQTASAEQRSKFSFTSNQLQQALTQAKTNGFKSFFIISTCNRSEAYGFCDSEEDIIGVFLCSKPGLQPLFSSVGFVYRDMAAVQYLFEVAAGLQSQILGDYEILSQLKFAISIARKEGLVGTVMDRVLNFAFQASKAIKTHTQLSNGTVSVSYAVIQWLQENAPQHGQHILVVGTGALGKSVVKNLRRYLQPAVVCITNRTNKAAAELAKELHVKQVPFSNLYTAVNEADIIIVCSQAADYLITAERILHQGSKVFIDLAVPNNIHPNVGMLADTRLVGVDEVSKTLHCTFQNRKTQLPKAQQIVQEYTNLFLQWLSFYKHAPAIQEMKIKLESISHLVGSDSSCCFTKDHHIQKTLGAFASSVKQTKAVGCHYITAMHSFLTANEIRNA